MSQADLGFQVFQFKIGPTINAFLPLQISQGVLISSSGMNAYEVLQNLCWPSFPLLSLAVSVKTTEDRSATEGLTAVLELSFTFRQDSIFRKYLILRNKNYFGDTSYAYIAGILYTCIQPRLTAAPVRRPGSTMQRRVQDGKVVRAKSADPMKVYSVVYSGGGVG